MPTPLSEISVIFLKNPHWTTSLPNSKTFIIPHCFHVKLKLLSLASKVLSIYVLISLTQCLPIPPSLSSSSLCASQWHSAPRILCICSAASSSSSSLALWHPAWLCLLCLGKVRATASVALHTLRYWFPSATSTCSMQSHAWNILRKKHLVEQMNRWPWQMAEHSWTPRSSGPGCHESFHSEGSQEIITGQF